jgi:two-component system sensor kinase FixL
VPAIGDPGAAGGEAPQAVIARLGERRIFEEAQRTASVGTWTYDYAAGMVTWSDDLYRMFGLSPDTFRPSFESFMDYVHPDDREAMLAANRDSFALGKPMCFEHRIVRPDGEVRHVLEQAQIVIGDEAGGHPILIGTTQDITERRRAEEKVAAQEAKMRELQGRMVNFARQNAMATMAATLAHEINQPLSAISNYATALRRKIDETGAESLISTGLAEIESNALRAGEIIRRTRSMAERRELKKERIDFDALVRSAMEFSTLWCEGVSVEFVGRATGFVEADHIQIAQVLTNFIRNACEAMEHSDPKILTVSTMEDEARVTICVSDTGPGIAPGLSLFEATESSKEHGMGIGLSICRTIIEAHKGRIWTERPARGARFCFSLPRADAAAP